MSSQSRSAEIGYWLSKEAEGHGIISKVCPFVLQYVFDELEVHRVQICCAHDNHRSQKIPERPGFAREGVLRGAASIRDVYSEVVVFGLLAEEWLAQTQGRRREPGARSPAGRSGERPGVPAEGG